MLKFANCKRLLLDWPPAGAGLSGLLALAWWLGLHWPLRLGLRAALGGATPGKTGGDGPPTRPRRPRSRSRADYPHLSLPSAA